MASIYKKDIPQPTNKLSQSQGDLLGNFQQLDITMGVDHFDFSDNTENNGKHQKVTLPVQTSPPPSSVSGDGVLYTTANASKSDLYYARDNDGKVYQMTRVTNDVTEQDRFATNTTYATNNTGGWTFLPGGMLLQYGVGVSSGTSIGNLTVTFPKPFTNIAFSITYGSFALSATPDSRVYVSTETRSSTGFTATTRISTGGKTGFMEVSWVAIGV